MQHGKENVAFVEGNLKMSLLLVSAAFYSVLPIGRLFKKGQNKRGGGVGRPNPNLLPNIDKF
jgi:hypothetical protein